MEKSFKLMSSLRASFKEISCALAAATVLFTYHHLFKTGIKQNYKKIPVPPSSLPIIGHMLSLGRLPGRTFSQWLHKLGPIIKIKMGIQTWIIVDDPYLAHKIFVKNGADTSFRFPNVFGDYYSFHGKGIIYSQPNGPGPNPRSVVLSIIGPKQVEKYIELIQLEAKDTATTLVEITQKNGGTNPTQIFALYSSNIMVSALFGKRFESIYDPEFIQLSNIVEASIKLAPIDEVLANFFPILGIYDYLSGKQSKIKHHVDNERNPLLRKLIREAVMCEGPNAIKNLKEEEYGLSENDLIAYMSDLIIAGVDTVIATLTWNIAILCNHPDVQKKVSAEIDKFVELIGRLPHFSEREQLPYCISVIKECMRYKATTSLGLIHVTRKDIEVDGYMIRKGSSIISNMESMHKKSEIYPEPEKFLPERFMNNTKTMQSAANGSIEERDHYNFGWGRRICPGIHLAEAQLFLVFVQIFSTCYIEPVNGMPEIEDAVNSGLVLTPRHFEVKFNQRSDSLV